MGSTQTQSTQGTSKRSRAARGGTKKPKYNYDDSDVEEIDDDSYDDTPAPPKSRAKKKGAASGGTSRAKAASQTQSTMSSFTNTTRKPAQKATTSRRNVQYVDSSDEEPSTLGTASWGQASQSTKGRSRR